MEFKPFPKIARLARRIIVTEKIDGTNASIHISTEEPRPDDRVTTRVTDKDGVVWTIRAGSRTRWITPDDDNFGFAAWVRDNAEELAQLGEGRHFGEWWGKGIQRGYGLEERRFSLFNTDRWQSSFARPAGVNVVPVLYDGEFNSHSVECVLDELRTNGSLAAPGFMQPEGIVVYHTAANLCFKQTCEHDSEPKNAHVKKDRPAQQKRPPSNPDTTGRRKGCDDYVGRRLRSTDLPYDPPVLAVSIAEETAGSFE